MDEAALVHALNSGHAASCGLDFYEEESDIYPGLIENQYVMLLPHMGPWTVETQTSMEESCIANVRKAVETGKLRSSVPEHAEQAAVVCR